MNLGLSEDQLAKLLALVQKTQDQPFRTGELRNP